jgi:ankyrin repeat protein
MIYFFLIIYFFCFGIVQASSEEKMSEWYEKMSFNTMGNTHLMDEIENICFDVNSKKYVFGELDSVLLLYIRRDNIAFLNRKNKEGRTALHFAVIYKEIEIVKALLDVGVDKEIKDIYGRSAQDYIFLFDLKQRDNAYVNKANDALCHLFHVYCFE